VSIYKKQLGLKGSTVYIKDRRFIKKAYVPGNIMKLLETQDEVDDENLKLEAPLKECIACGMGAKMYRLIANQPVYVCDGHYQELTLGQVAQVLRERNTDPLLAV
jgi:hypothetical protein